MIDILLIAAFFGIPAAVFIWLIVSIVRFVRTPKDNSELRKKRRILLIISSVIFVIMTAMSIILFSHTMLFCIATAALAWFIVSLIMYIRTQKNDTDKRKKCRLMLIISSVIFVIMTAVTIGLMWSKMSSVSEILEWLIIYAVILDIPIAALAWFIVSLVLYICTPKSDTVKRKKRRLMLIISSVIFGVITAAIIGLIVSFSMSMRYM